MFVSRDRYIIDKIADRIITIKNLTTKEYNGDYAYYQTEMKKMQEKQPAIQNNSVKLHESNKKSQTSVNMSFSEPKNAKSKNVKKLELLENSIDEIEEKIRSLEILTGANSSDRVRLKELFEEKEEASK